MKRKKWDTSVWGISLVASDYAVQQGIAKSGQRGILLGGRGGLWKVVKEGTTTSGIYAREFWELRSLTSPGQ